MGHAKKPSSNANFGAKFRDGSKIYKNWLAALSDGNSTHM